MFDLDKDQWQALKPVLEAAAHASASDRAAVLDRALAHDPHLLECARQMLQQYDTATQRFDSLGAGGPAHPTRVGDSSSHAGVAIGQTVAHYRVLRKLGEGGMGIVYLAEDERLGRQVALKILSTTRTATVADARAQLLAESRAAAVLNHPAIVTLLELVDTGNELVAVMEYVEGRPLSALIAEPLPLGFALRLAVQLADALAYAHGRGIVHCDLKPANIHILPSGSPKILDFGLARALAGSVHATDTQQGPLFGTPGYVAPERLLGREPAAAADVYALGVILYRLLTGSAPFPTEDQAQLFFDTVMTIPKAPSLVIAGVPAAVDDVVMRCLAKAPRERLQPHEVTRALNASLRELETAAIAYVATSPNVGGPVVPTTTSLSTPATSTASRLSTFTAQALLFVSAAAVSGLMTCWTFNSVIGRPSAFDPDSVLTQTFMGFRLMVTPAAIASLVFAGVGGLDLARLLVAKTQRGRGMFARLGALLAPHQGDLAATLAQSVVLAGLALFVLLYLSFGDVISAVMARLSSSPPIDVRPLQPANHSHVVLFRMFTSGVFVVVLIGYRTARGAAAQYGGHISSNVRMALYGLMAVLLIVLQAPYKLSQQNAALPVVVHDSQRCYLLGDTGEQSRVYCPGWQVPRVRTVPRTESSISPCGFDENIFVGAISAQCY